MIDQEILTSYVEKVYGYAFSRTYSREEAEELSQEILLNALRSLPKLADESKFEPWLWGIASNVTKSFRRNMGKQRAMYSYDAMPEDIAEDCDDDTSEEDYARLREKISRLSSAYRDIILLHYYDDLGVKEIAEKLDLPLGTVTWRLSEARNRLKKEYNNMEETALRPKKMHISIYGTGNYHGNEHPFPSVYINDALSQNILLHCYDEVRSVEELSKLCGVPAYYIEDRIENLLRRNAVIESNRKYRTDFIIWSDKHGIYSEENAEKAVLPIAERMTDAILALSDNAYELDFYKADKSKEKLTLLFAVMAFEEMSQKYNPIESKPIPANYDGFWWRYTGNIETGAHPRTGIVRRGCSNNESRGTYSHMTYTFGGFGHKDMMFDSEINVCEDLITTGKTDDRDALALALENGNIVKQGDNLFVPTPAFNAEAYKNFAKIAEKHLVPLMDEYAAIVKKYTDGYAKLFPAHLADDITRQCRYTFLSLLEPIVRYGQRSGKFVVPEDEVCDVMVQHRRVDVF